LLIAFGLNVNDVNESGESLLTRLAWHGAFDAARWLLDHGALVEGGADPGTKTPLLNAVANGHVGMVELLLHRGADPNRCCGNPARNALARAVLFGKEEVAKLLSSRGISEITIRPELINVEDPAFMAPSTLSPSDWHGTKWGPVYNYVQAHGLAVVCEKNQVLFLVGYLVNQLCNGGAFTVYFNPSAEYTPQIPAALDKIGATRAARVIREINALFPGGVPDEDMDQRAVQIEKLPAEASDKGWVLEQIFDEWIPDGSERVLVQQLFDFYHGGG
jgi:hypothetical protein